MGQSIKTMTFGTFILNIYTRVLYISGDFNLAFSMELRQQFTTQY